MTDPLRLALWQTTSPAGDVAVAMAALRPMLMAAGAAGAALLVGPESYFPGYNHDRIADLAQPRGGPWQQLLAAMCRQAGCGLVIGYAERDGDTIYNSAVAFSAGGDEIGHYRKVQLYGPREKAIYQPGDAYASFDHAGHRLGLLICYDVEFAAHVAALAARGCSAVLVPTANMLPFTHVARVTVPAQAVNHGLAIVYANYCGVEGDLAYAGGSVIAGPHGEVVAQAGATPALLIADLPVPDPGYLSTQSADFRPVG